jgi:hypothetical protein
MRLSLKDVGVDVQSHDRTYGQSVTGKPYFHQPSHNSCFLVALVELELMICLFSVVEVMEPQGNFMEELYGPGEYKLTWMLCCYFSCIARILYRCQPFIFCNSHEIHFGTTGNSLL